MIMYILSFLGSLIFWMSCTILRCLSDSITALQCQSNSPAIREGRGRSSSLHFSKNLFPIFVRHLGIIQLF